MLHAIYDILIFTSPGPATNFTEGHGLGPIFHAGLKYFGGDFDIEPQYASPLLKPGIDTHYKATLHCMQMASSCPNSMASKVPESAQRESKGSL